MRTASTPQGNYRLHAMGAVCYLPSWQEVVKACAYLAPTVLVSVYQPDGTQRVRNSTAQSVTALGRPLASHLRQKAQARRAR